MVTSKSHPTLDHLIVRDGSAGTADRESIRIQPFETLTTNQAY